MTSLPLWLQIVGLVAGLLWPSYQLLRALIGPKLEVKLTQDLFFRFIEMGECLFMRSVLIAEHGNVLIKKVEAKLKRLGPASKVWELEFLKFGEVMIDNKSVDPNFCFHSSSPFKFLSKGLPVQAVYLARAKEYGTEYASIIKKFGEKLLPIKDEAIQVTNDPENKKQNELNKRIQKLSKDYAGKIFDKIQLEAGTYEISLQITYGSISGLSAYFNRRTKRSKLSFEIEENAREQIKSALPAAVQNGALNKVYNSNLIVWYPEYAPINKREEL